MGAKAPETVDPGIIPPETSANHQNEEDSKYNRFTSRQKASMVGVLCYYSFLTPINSTAAFVATPELVADFQSTPVVVNLSNALFFVFMALGPLFWGPMAQGVGRRPVIIVSCILLTIFSAATAAAPNLPAYFIFRMLSAFQGTAVLVVGSVVIGDLYAPSNRGRAVSLFLAGTVCGPAIAPLLGGIAVTFATWRIIFWVITGLSGLCVVLLALVLKETGPAVTSDTEEKGAQGWLARIRKTFKPGVVVVSLLTYPNLRVAAIAVSSIVWNQYSLLAPIRYVINPRFNLTTPIETALFFLPPACGCICGSFFGGWWSDYVATRQMHKKGRRIPEDRLKSCAPLLATVQPAFTILYGWSVQKEIGGIPLVVIAMFLQSFTQMLCIPSLNTYLVEVMQEQGMSSIAVAGNYLARFMFAAAGTAACLPAINTMGVGWFSTISGLFMAGSAVLVFILTLKGEKWHGKPKS